MLPERLRVYLDSKGLCGSDVPKIVAAWYGLKAVTKGTLLVVGIRYQPLSRIFTRAYRPFRERVKVRTSRELDRISAHDSWYARQGQRVVRQHGRLVQWRDSGRAFVRRRMGIWRNNQGLYDRFASWYRKEAEAKSEWVAKNSHFVTLARLTSQEPRRLAVGAAEGLIMSLLLSPVYYPVAFYVAVRYYMINGQGSKSHLQELSELGSYPSDTWREEE